MTEIELLQAIQTGIEALESAPLSTFEVFVLDQVGELPSECVILNLTSDAEVPIGITAGVGRFNEHVGVQIHAQFEAADTAANVAKVFSVRAQLRKFIRDNRQISAGGDTAVYATITGGGETGFMVSGDNEGYRYTTINTEWRIPEETG